MTEFELKLIVPDAARAALERAVATPSVQRTRLRAAYFDTPGRALAGAGMALRLRLEGRQWVQTLKTGRPGSLERFEHNVALAGSAASQPALDVQRHAGTPGGEALIALIGQGAAAADGALVEAYRTDITRSHRLMRVAGGSVELAFDLGHLAAGTRRLPVCELEIELKNGPVGIVFEVARRFVRRHGLWLDVRSKAERGDRLARGLEVGEVRRAPKVALARTMTPDTAARACLGTLVPAVLVHASEVSSGVYAPEHLHQTRVALRRLRTALRFVDGWAGADVEAWQQGLVAPFRQLGQARDQDVFAATLLPQLQAAGMPGWTGEPVPGEAEVADAAPDAVSPPQAVRAPAFNLLLLDLLAFAHGTPAVPLPETATAATAALAARSLQRLHRQVRHDARHFAELGDEHRHRLRRRVKRLRYSVEFARGLFAGKAVRRYLKRLEPVQTALGELNDVVVALDWARAQAEHAPPAWFAVGWLTAQRDARVEECAASLPAFLKSEPFWPKPKKTDKPDKADKADKAGKAEP